METRVKSYLKIKVDNPELASKIIEENLNTKNYKVVSSDTICIYDISDKSSVVNTLLVQNGVTVESITKLGGDYEDYFIKLMGGQSDD